MSKENKIDVVDVESNGIIIFLEKLSKQKSEVSYNVVLLYNTFQVNLTWKIVETDKETNYYMEVLATEIILTEKDAKSIYDFLSKEIAQ